MAVSLCTLCARMRTKQPRGQVALGKQPGFGPLEDDLAALQSLTKVELAGEAVTVLAPMVDSPRVAPPLNAAASEFSYRRVVTGVSRY